MARSERPRIITVASGKGGVGKSSICVNLAVALGQLGKRTLIVDSDFGLSNIDVMLGVSSKLSLEHFFRGQCGIDDIVQIAYDGIRYVSGGSGRDDLMKITRKQIADLMRALRKTNLPVDYILCDAGAGIGDGVTGLIEGSDEVFVITAPEPTAAMDAYALIKVVNGKRPNLPVSIVINRVISARDAISITEGFINMIKTGLQINPNFLGFIGEDVEVSRSVRRQTPIMVTNPEAKFSRDIRSLAREMLGLPPLVKTNGVFARMLHKAMSAIFGIDSPEPRDIEEYERLLEKNRKTEPYITEMFIPNRREPEPEVIDQDPEETDESEPPEEPESSEDEEAPIAEAAEHTSIYDDLDDIMDQ